MKSIRTKIVVVFAIAASVFVMINAVVFATQAILVAGYAQVTDTIVEEYRVLEAAPELVEAYNSLLKLSHSPERQRQYEAIRSEMEGLILGLDEKVVAAESRLALRGLKNSVSTLLSEGRVGIEEARRGEVEKYTIRFDEANRLAGFVKTNATELILKEINYARDQQQRLEINQRNTSFAGSALTIILGLLAAVYVIVVTGRILKPLARLDSLVKTIADGDLKVSVGPEVKQRDDEVGRLAGSVDRMTVSLREMIRRIEENSVRVKSIMENAPYGAHTYRLEADGRLVFVAANQSAEKILNLDHHPLFGKTLEEAFPGNVGTEIPEAYRRVARTGEKYERTDYAYDAKGLKGVFEITAVQTDRGEMTAFFRDVSERYRNERALKVLSRCNEIIVRTQSEEVLGQDICASIVEVGGYRLAWIGYGENDAAKTVRPVARAGKDEGFLEALKPSWAADERGNIPVGHAIRTGEPFVAQSISGGGNSRWEKLARERGYGAVCALPLLIDGKAFGALVVFAAEEEAFDEREMALLRELASDTAFGIQSIRERTARRAAEESVRRSEEKFRTLVENTSDITGNFTPDGITTYVSPQVTAWGFTPDQIVGKNWFGFLHPDDRETVQKRFAEMFETRQDLAVVARVVNPVGRVIWMDTRSHIVFGEDGKPEAIYSIARDITAQREAELALAESERRYRALVENSTDIISSFTAEGIITYISPQVEVTGAKVEQIIGRSIMDFIHPDDRPMAQEEFANMLKRRKGGSIITRTFNPSGLVTWMDIHTRLVQDASGKTFSFFSVLRDITAQREAELALAESERRYRAYVENTEDVIFAVDKTGVLTYVSPQIKHYGLVSDKVVGRNFVEFVHPDDRGWLGDLFRLDMEGKRQSELSTFRFVNAEGKVFWVEEVDNVERDAAGNPNGMIGTMRDITERRAAEEKVTELNRLRTKFIQVIAHQLRTPLNSIRWSLEALLAGEVGEMKKEQRDFVKVVYDAEIEIIGRIHEMITALDIEENRVTLDREEVSLASLVGSVVGELAAAAEKHQAKITYEAGFDPSITVNVDSEKTRFAVRTLIHNAIIYGREGGEVKVKTERADGALKVAVSDQGIGIPETEKANIFRRFFRASNASVVNQNASGLGLSIAKYYVEKQGGRIGFESKPGEGTTFWIEFPVKPEVHA